MKSTLVFLFLLGLVASTLSDGTTPSLQKLCPTAYTCLSELQEAQSQVNISMVCSSFKKGGSCLTAVEDKCPEQLKSMFNDALIEISDQEMKMGCSGSCGVAAEMCLKNMAALADPSAKFDTSICGTLQSSLDCLKNLESTKCGKNITNVLTQFATFTKAQKYNDYCDKNGKVTPCFNDVFNCGKDVKTVTNNESWSDVCKKADDYFKCEEKVVCAGKLNQAKAAVRKQLQNDESQFKCPTIGTCTERFTSCSYLSLVAIKENVDVCVELPNTVACFAEVRKDPLCKNVDETDVEKTMKSKNQSTCGATSLLVSTALLFLGVTVSSLKKYL